MVHAKHSPCGRFLVSASLIGEIVFLVLFLVGPAGASLDSDADGIPDIPVVVTASSPLAEISHIAAKIRLVSLHSAKGYDPVVLTLARMLCNPWNPHAPRVHPSSPHLQLQLFCLMRC